MLWSEYLEKQRLRCVEQGHSWQGAVDIFLGVYKKCRWCETKQEFL